MDWKQEALTLLKLFIEGENTSRMVSHLRGNKKKASVINNFVPAGLTWFIRITSFGFLYVVLYRLYRGEYPPYSIIIFLIIPWLSLSLGLAILTASKEQEDLNKLKNDTRFQDMDKVTIYHDKLKKSFYYSTVFKAKRSYLDEEVIKESIGFIEEVLKPYGIDPLSCNVPLEDVEKYLGNISVIRDFISSTNLEEAKQVRIRWNANHMLSQTDK
ncbi:hypothetical protein V9J15_02085 [Candidatus Liberibacter africanus]|uniref:hypothetical protein n=1 Tax=Liberibacter africanus TaxID=34020 RepID=UPI00339D7C59